MNDIVAVGVESFYATNDHSFSNDILHTAIVILGLPWCDVVYYSPEEVRVAAGGIMSSNGINISPDKRLSAAPVSAYCLIPKKCFLCQSAKLGCSFFRYIYVADILDHEIDVFERQEGEHLEYLKVRWCCFLWKTHLN